MNTLATRRPTPKTAVAITLTGGLIAAAVSFGSVAHAATAVPLGTSAQFAVLAGAGVTNTGSTTIQTVDASVRGDVGTSPTNTITGEAGISWLAPATGSLHKADAVALQAQADNLIAYNAATGAPTSTALGAQLDGVTLLAGVHTAGTTLNLAENGTVTLDAENDPAAVFIFQVGSSLTMEVASTVALVNGANPCNVFWQVSEDATIKTNAVFQGTLLAENAIVAQSGADFIGRLLAQNASVTLDNNTFVLPACGAAEGSDDTADGTDADGTGTDGTDGTDADGADADGTGTDGTDADGGTDTDGSADGADADGTGTDGTDADGGTNTDADGADAGNDADSSGAGTDSGRDADGDASSQTLGLPSTGGPSYTLWIAGIGFVVVGAFTMAASRTPKGAHRA